jgi:ATP-dependent DNA helicase HFM1/MER3
MSKYYLAFATMQRFNALPPTAGVEEVLDALVGASELREIALRRGDKKELNAVNKQLRFPRDGKINEREQKLHCLVQATLDGRKFEQWTLNNEAKTVFNHITRIVRCLAETVATKGAFAAITSTLQLVAACKNRMWHDSEHVTRQLPHIGDVMSAALASAGVTSLRALAALDARRIEAIVGRRPPFGDEVHRSLAAVPCFAVKLEYAGAGAGAANATVTVTVNRTNFADGAGGRSSRYPDVALVVGDTVANRVLLFKKFQSSRANVAFSVNVSYPQTYLTARVSLLDYVGQDVESETIVRYPNRMPPQRTAATAVAAAAAKSNGGQASPRRQAVQAHVRRQALVRAPLLQGRPRRAAAAGRRVAAAGESGARRDVIRQWRHQRRSVARVDGDR